MMLNVRKIATPNAAPRPADAETRGTDDHHASLRLWLRLLTCTQMVEREIRARMRERFAITLARFDLMAQLERYPQGLRMGELSRRMMVTGGNVTGLTSELVAEGLVARTPMPEDRRSYVVCLTEKGKAAFDAMATEHERWIIAMLSEVTPPDRADLYQLLGMLKHSVARVPEGG